MPVRLTLDVFGERQVDRTLEALDARAQDLTPVWEHLAERFTAAEARQFASEGRYGSGGWPALEPGYGAWKAAHYPGKGILRRSDDLFRSLTVGPAVRVIEPHQMIVGSDVDYGLFHQRGEGVPRRRPVELPEQERREWVQAIQRYLTTGRPT